jgi:hypothetical protein
LRGVGHGSAALRNAQRVRDQQTSGYTMGSCAHRVALRSSDNFHFYFIVNNHLPLQTVAGSFYFELGASKASCLCCSVDTVHECGGRLVLMKYVVCEIPWNLNDGSLTRHKQSNNPKNTQHFYAKRGLNEQRQPPKQFVFVVYF